MHELLLLLYASAVLGLTILTIKHHGLLVKPPGVQLAEKRALMEEAMRVLHSCMCPLCGSTDTYIESIDLWKTNTVVVACNNSRCRQRSMWKLENHVWRLIAPYRVAFSVPAEIEAKRMPEVAEEVKLEF